MFDVEQEGCAQKVGTDSMVLGASVNHYNPKRILDIGTGNGVIALMMAQKFEKSEITGIEIQKACSAVAKSNYNNSIYSDRLDLLNADFIDYQFSDKFDLIVTNPPFFENSTESLNTERNISRHQSTMKLKDLLSTAANNLNFNGAIWLIVPKESSDELITKSSEFDLSLFQRIRVFGKPHIHKRDILVFIKTEVTSTFTNQSFTIRDAEGNYTEEYKTRTIDYHYYQL